MARAVFNGTVIAESSETELVEGNHCFPPDSIKEEYFEPSDVTTVCPWKGTASYYDVVVDGERSNAAAWYYPEASAAAKRIEGYVAFWKGVRVEA